MSSHNRTPEARPLKRYSTPKYPSHQDPNPTVYPVPVPYPFRSGAISALAGIGLATATVSMAAEPETQPKASDNPLRLELSGLPYHTSSYGTGQPSYIQDKVARNAIEAIFAKEGIDLKKSYKYSKDGIRFIADGYNEKLKIGYFFGGWQTLEQDAVISWMTRGEDKKAVLTKKQLKRHLQLMNYTHHADLKADIKAASSMEDVEKMREAYNKIVEKVGNERLSLSEAKALEQRAEAGKEFIAVVSQFDTRFASSGWGGRSSEEMKAELKRIETLETRKEKQEARRELREQMATHGLEALEKAVRQYIHWARGQGVQ
jgi:hypothetical protein